MATEVQRQAESDTEAREKTSDAGLWATIRQTATRLSSKISKSLERQKIVPTHAVMHDLLTKEMVEEFNVARRDNPNYKPDLSDKYFIGKSLGGVDLRNAIAKRAHFDDSDLSGALLEGIVLTGGRIENTALVEAKMNGAFLDSVEGDGADFTGAEMQNINIDRSQMIGADFSGANMADASMNKTDVESADFNGTILDRASMVETDLRLADLGGASVKGVDFTTAQTAGAFFRGVKIDGQTKLPEDLTDIIEEHDDLGEID